MVKTKTQGKNLQSLQTLAEKIAPNGYFFGSYRMGETMVDDKYVEFEFRYVIADLRRFRLLPLYGDGTKHTVQKALPIALKIPNLRWFSNGVHFGGDVINGDLRGYDLTDKDLSNRRSIQGFPVDKVEYRHYAGQYWESGKIKTGRGSFSSSPPIPSNISTVLSGAGVILKSDDLNPDLPKTEYKEQLVAANSSGWEAELEPLSPGCNRARWAIGRFDAHHVVLVSVGAGEKNVKHTQDGGVILVHHGLTIQQFAKAIKDIGNLVSDAKVDCAVTYDGSKPMGCAVAENSMMEAFLRAKAYDPTASYQALIRRAHGVIELIGKSGVICSEKPPQIKVKVKKTAQKTFEFDVQFRVRALESDKPHKVTLEVDPSDNLTVEPNTWTAGEINLDPKDGWWDKVATVGFSLNPRPKSRKLNVVLRGEDAGGQELFIHKVPILLVWRLRTTAILDNSGSMGSNDPDGNRFGALRVFSARYLAAAVTATRDVTKNRVVAVPSDEHEREASLVSFSDTASILTGFVANRAAFDSVIAGVGEPGGGTNFNDALAVAGSLCGDEDFLTTYNIIFFTDGKHNAGEFDWSIPNRFEACGIAVHSISLGSDTNASLLSAISAQTSGRYFHLRSPADMAGIYGVLLSDVLDEDVSETISGEIPTGGQILRPVLIRGSGVSTIQVTWDLSRPPPEILVRDAEGNVIAPVVIGDGFAVYQSDEFAGQGEWEILATASDDATRPTPIGIVVTEASSIGDRIRLIAEPIPARRFVGEMLSFEASLTERGQPIPEDESDNDQPASGHARVRAEVMVPSDGTRIFPMSQETGRTGVFLRSDALELTEPGIYNIEIIAAGVDTGAAPYRRSFKASLVVAHRIFFEDATVPETASESADMNVSVRIAADSIQPETVKLLGRIGTEGSFTSYALTRSRQSWRGTVPGDALAAGTFESYFLAEGENAHGVAPEGAPDALYQTRVKVGPYAWLLEFKHHVGNRHMSARGRRMRRNDIPVDLAGFNMPTALRQPANYLIPRELISVNSADGSLWCTHVENPMVPEPIRSLVKLTAEGQLVKLPVFPNVDVVNHKAFTVDGANNRIWLGFLQKLILLDIDSGEILREITKVNILGLAPDPSTGGIWAGARLRVGSQTMSVLHRFDADPSGEKDKLVAIVQPPDRAFVHPLTSGDVICFATYARVPRVVRVGADGKVKAAETATRPRPVEMTVDPETGRVWVVTQRLGRFVVEVLGPDLKPEKTIRAWEDLKLVFLYSVDFKPSTGDLWLSGAVQAGGVTGRIDSSGTFHRLVPRGEVQGLVRTFQST